MSLIQASAAIDRRRRIHLGMELLSDRRPTWRDEVNADRLVMSEYQGGDTGCVLAQVFGTYGRGLVGLGLHYEDGTPDYNAGSDFGFDVGVNDSYHELTVAWRDEIRYEQMQ